MTALDYFKKYAEALLYEFSNLGGYFEPTTKSKLITEFLEEAAVSLEARKDKPLDIRRDALRFQNERWNVLVRLIEKRYPDYEKYPIVLDEFMTHAKEKWPEFI